MADNTLFLRLEGPLQAWGSASKFVIRDTDDVPTKSGVLGMICCAKRVRRPDARPDLERLNRLCMGVRIDRPGTRWHDYHTVGAGYGLLSAEGKIKRTASTGEIETLVSRRYYLCDASFLVTLQGDAGLIHEVCEAVAAPKWTMFLGRKSCPPARPVLLCGGDDGEPLGSFADLREALTGRPWRPRFEGDGAPCDVRPRAGQKVTLNAVLECLVVPGVDLPPEAQPCQDVAISFDPPVHHPRYVLKAQLAVPVGQPTQTHCPSPPRRRADYQDGEYRAARTARLKDDHGLCVFCKAPASTMQHITYRRAGGDETQEDLRSLCRLCHDAATMIEYGLGMGLDRIDPCEPRWRDDILRTRGEILAFRSEEGRRRALRDAPEKVRHELLEEEAR